MALTDAYAVEEQPASMPYVHLTSFDEVFFWWSRNWPCNEGEARKHKNQTEMLRNTKKGN